MMNHDSIHDVWSSMMDAVKIIIQTNNTVAINHMLLFSATYSCYQVLTTIFQASSIHHEQYIILLDRSQKRAKASSTSCIYGSPCCTLQGAVPRALRSKVTKYPVLSINNMEKFPPFSPSKRIYVDAYSVSSAQSTWSTHKLKPPPTLLK